VTKRRTARTSPPVPPGVRAVTPITPGDVGDWMRLTPEDVADDLEILQAICDASMGWASRLPYVAGLGTEVDWPPDVRQGVVQLAARWYRRRLTPSGIDAITDAGAVYVARSDPEISQLLHLDSWAFPAVG